MNTSIGQNWVVDHIGVCVADLEQAIAVYRNTTGATVALRETLESQGVELVFLSTGETKIELLSPLRPDSTLGRFLHKRGPGLHHICYRVTDIRFELKRLAGLGLRLIDTQPRSGAGGTQIAFIHPDSCLGTLTEICEYSST
jgi:methylmalonyl-CoA/ethylmalonyl-CoA epimerase